jgi:hypothetical protein
VLLVSFLPIGALAAPAADLIVRQRTTVPPNAVLGKTYQQWSADWWRWALTIPSSEHPALGSGADCVASPTTGVWFLAASVLTQDVIERACEVPHGTRVFFPVVASESDGVGVAPPPSIHALRDQAAGPINRARNLAVQLDGQSVPEVSLTGPYRIRSTAFQYSYPATSILCFIRSCGVTGYEEAGGTVPTAVSDGVFIMTLPLDAGEHTIRFAGELPTLGRRVEASYLITVQPR